MGCGGSKDEKKPQEDKKKGSAKNEKPKADAKTSTFAPSAKRQAQDYPEENKEQENGAGAAADDSHAPSISESSPHSVHSLHTAGTMSARATTPEAHSAEHAAGDAAEETADLGEAEPQARAVDEERVPYSARRECASVARIAAPGTPRKAVPTEIYAMKMRRVEADSADVQEVPKSPRIMKPMPLRCRNTRMSVVKQRRLAQMNHHDDPNEYKQLD